MTFMDTLLKMALCPEYNLTELISVVCVIFALYYLVCRLIPPKKRPLSFTVATAESCTVCKVYGWLASKSGASWYLRRGQGAYHIDEKVEHLNVNRQNAVECNCVNRQVAEEMAESLFEAGHALSVSTTGYVGNSEECCNPFFWFSIVSPFDKISYRCEIKLGYVTQEMTEAIKLIPYESERIVCQTLFAYIVMCKIDEYFNETRGIFNTKFNDDDNMQHFATNMKSMDLSIDRVMSAVKLEEFRTIKLEKMLIMSSQVESHKDK